MKTLPPEILSAWLEALESGEYKQTTATLKDDVGYCCLGVLCHVVVDKAPDLAELYRIVETDNGIEASGSTSFLGESFAEDMGFDSHIGNKQLDAVLMDMNDDKDNTFSEIADFIRWAYHQLTY